jgi:hypothetical protein
VCPGEARRADRRDRVTQGNVIADVIDFNTPGEHRGHRGDIGYVTSYEGGTYTKDGTTVTPLPVTGFVDRTRHHAADATSTRRSRRRTGVHTRQLHRGHGLPDVRRRLRPSRRRPRRADGVAAG